MPGYLSLHQNIQSLTIKWTPNQLMNGYTDNEGSDLSSYWAYALNINVDEIVYVHCHQNRGEDTGGTVILVGQDGVQRPPIHFPEGGHMQAFLSCLETGLLPHGQLDPPLWSQRGIGKMFPWPKSVRRRILPSVMESSDETPIDYVFRVVSKSQHEEFCKSATLSWRNYEKYIFLCSGHPSHFGIGSHQSETQTLGQLFHHRQQWLFQQEFINGAEHKC